MTYHGQFQDEEMKVKLAAALLCAASLSACSSVGTKPPQPVMLTLTFTSDVALPSQTSMRLSPEESRHITFLLEPNVRKLDQIRGTYHAYDGRMDFEFQIAPQKDGTELFQYVGALDYLSSLNLSDVNGKVTIGGDLVKHFEIPAGSEPLKIDSPIEVELPSGITLTVMLEPASRYESGPKLSSR